MRSCLLLRRLAILLFVSCLLGLVIGGVEAATETRANDWLHFELHGLIRWQLARSLIFWIGLVTSAALAVYLLRLLLSLRPSGIAGADRLLALFAGAVVGLLIAGSWGFHLNRYTYKEFWKPDRFQPFFGMMLPPGLFSAKLLLINLAIAFAGLAIAYLLYRLLLFPLRKFSGSITRASSWWRVALAGSLTILAGLPVLRWSPRPKGPNIILISVDTLRADHLGIYGYPRPTSPNIDMLAQGGVVFENAFAQANWTLPSHLSLMTSQIPDSHGVLYSHQRLPKSKVTLAEILRNAGYRTVAFTGGDFVESRFGFGQGFDSYSNGPPLYYHTNDDWARYHQAPRLAHILPAARRWLVSRRDEPFFLFIHCWDPHAPYLPHPDNIEDFFPRYRGDLAAVTLDVFHALEDGRKTVGPDDIDRIRALYDSEIRHMDDSVGELVEILIGEGLEDSLIVFTSDHGDRLMEHGIGHGRFLYDGEIHVPLAVVYPAAVPAGKRVSAVVESIDVVPTILDLASIPFPDEVRRELQGHSLRGEWDDPCADSVAYSQTGKGGTRSLRTQRFKYIVTTHEEQSPEEAVYDILEDPGETTNVGRQRPELLGELRERYRKHVMALPTVHSAGHAEPVKLDEDLKERLRALGYLEE